MKKYIYKRKFGQYDVEVIANQISILGNTNSNFGTFYNFSERFEAFKKQPLGKNNDWNRPQVIAMDWEYGLTQSVKEWLYNLVRKDKIETKEA